MVDIQNNNRNPALPVVVCTLVGLLIACFVGWAFGFSIVVGSDSRDHDIDAASYNTFSVALLVERIVAFITLVLVCCFKKEHLFKLAACGLILTGVANLVTAFVLIRTFDSRHEEDKVPLSTWIMSSLPCLFWTIAGILILKLPGNDHVDDTPTSIIDGAPEVDSEAFLPEIGDGTRLRY